MKKSTRKLVLRSETLRALVNIDLARAVGGADADVFDSGAKQCPNQALAESGAKQCPNR